MTSRVPGRFWAWASSLICGLLCLLGHCSVRAEGEPAQAPAKKLTLPEILAARPAPDLASLARRSAPTVRGPDATDSFWDLLKVREIAYPKAVPVLEEILVEN